MLWTAPPPASRCAKSRLLFRHHECPSLADLGSATGVSRLPLMAHNGHQPHGWLVAMVPNGAFCMGSTNLWEGYYTVSAASRSRPTPGPGLDAQNHPKANLGVGSPSNH